MSFHSSRHQTVRPVTTRSEQHCESTALNLYLIRQNDSLPITVSTTLSKKCICNPLLCFLYSLAATAPGNHILLAATTRFTF